MNIDATETPEAAMTELRYCPCCRKETRHRKLDKSLVADLLTAIITRFSADLRSPDYECNECGVRHD